MALGIGYGLPFVAQHGTNPYKTQWAAALEGAKGAGASVEDENAGTGSCLVSRGQDVYTDGLPSTPSLLIVPQFYKAGNLYQDVPPFVAEDTTMRFTVSRNTTATRVNSSGLIESVASGVPRIDWLGQSCPGLLVEASGQNLALQSEAFNVSGTWALVSGGTGSLPVVSANAVISPDGTQNAETVVFNRGAGNAAADLSLLQQGITIPTSGTYTFSVYAKASAAGDVGKQIFIRLGGAGGLIAITLTANWVRYSQAETSVASGSQIVQIGNRGTFTAGNSVSVDLWGAQVEANSVPTSYIPTTVAAVSRAADVISASGALVSGLIGQAEGTIYAEVDLRNWIASGRILTCSNGTSNERIIIQVGANRTLQAIVTTASADVVDISTASGQVNGVYKCALTYASGDFAFYVNGTQIGTDSSGGVPASTSVFLGKIGTSASTNFLNDRIRAAALYTTRLTDAQLAELTRL